MKLHERVDQSYQKLKQLQNETRAILLHPQSRYRSVVIAKLINDPEVKTYYYALGPDDVSLQAFIESITHNLITQVATFGRHLNMMPHYVYQAFAQHRDIVLEAFINELQDLSSEPYIIVLDEYDRSDEADDIHTFLFELIDRLPDQCRVIINGRTLPRLPWIAMIAKKQGLMLLDDQVISDNFYGTDTHNSHPPEMSIYGLGPGHIVINDQVVGNWEGHLPRLLLFFALDRPVVTRSEICDNFWPDLDSEQAVNVFHVTKRRLHKAIGQDILIHEGTHYRVNPNVTIYYDALDFAEKLMQARSDSQLESWQAVTQLYKGPFLHGHNDKWIDSRRQAFQAGYLEALTMQAAIYAADDKPEQALKLYSQAIEEDYERQDIHASIIELYQNLGRRSEAVTHYQEIEQRFQELGIQINPTLTKLYNQIIT